MKNIAVFFGGQSVEHEISVITGVLTVNSLDKTGYRAVPVYVGTDGVRYTGDYLKDPDNYKAFDGKKVKRVTFIPGDNALYLLKGKKIKRYIEIAAAINCMHGERGEDGSLAGELKTLGIPLASPDILPSSVCMDKTFTKIAMKGIGVKTLPSVTVKSAGEAEKIKLPFTYPVIVKPACGGSSIGVKKAENPEELVRAAAFALRFGERAVIEPCITEMTEINCAAYRTGDKIMVSECEKPFTSGAFLSFTDKYVKGKREFPADIPQKISEKIKKTTAAVYDKLGLSGVIRIDYFLVGENVFLNEVNTVPGSLAYYLFSDSLKGFTEMLTRLITECERKAAAKITEIRTFKSGILCGLGSKNGSKRL